jgi:trans-aconitate methyltransferase
MSSHVRSSPDDWEAHWASYADSAESNPAQRMRQELIVQLLCETKGSSDARVFDIGSGQGDLLRQLQHVWPNARLLGAELSARGVEISRRKLPEATFVVADIYQQPPLLDDFAGWATHAVCSEVLEHVDDPVSFLEHARKYLAPRAILIVTVPGGPMSAFDRHIGHRQHFDRRKIRTILEEAGYAVERVYLAGFPFFNLYRLLVIARGHRLAQDVERQSSGISVTVARAAMKIFRFLFRFTLRDSPFGWQVVAVARKASP